MLNSENYVYMVPIVIGNAGDKQEFTQIKSHEFRILTSSTACSACCQDAVDMLYADEGYNGTSPYRAPLRWDVGTTVM